MRPCWSTEASPPSRTGCDDTRSFGRPWPIKALANLIRFSRNHQQGQALVEMALVAPFLGMLFLGMLIISQFTSGQVDALESIRSSMRQSMHANAPGAFQRNTAKDDVAVDVPGKMKLVFQTPVIRQELQLHYYEGSYQGRGHNVYRTLGQPHREINE